MSTNANVVERLIFQGGLLDLNNTNVFLGSAALHQNENKVSRIAGVTGGITCIISPVIISATNLKAERLFVYGEEVNDFRTVDYEGLIILNISATQELRKQVIKLQ